MLGQVALPQWLIDLLWAYSQVFEELFWFFVGFVVVYVVGRIVFVPSVTRVVRSRNRNNPTILSATKTYLGVVVIGFAILTGILAAGYGRIIGDSAIVIAAITFAFGIAGQQLIGSLLSGLFLVADPDFNVGDWIEWPDGEGTVEAVDFRVTRVRTPNNETIAVPNTELTNNPIVRPYGRDTYRVTENFYVAYDEDTERALMEIQQLATNQDDVRAEPAPEARIRNLGENAITIRAEFWIDDPMDSDIPTIRSDFRRLVKRQFDEEDITLAPPSAQQLSGKVAVTERSGDSPASE